MTCLCFCCLHFCAFILCCWVEAVALLSCEWKSTLLQHVDGNCATYWQITSSLLALQPWVSLGLLNNQSPFLSCIASIHCFILIAFRSASASFIHLKQGLPFLLPTNSFPSIIFLGIAPAFILFTCPSHLILWAFINFTISSPFMDLFNWGKKLLNIKCMYWFSLQFCPKHFLWELSEIRS